MYDTTGLVLLALGFAAGFYIARHARPRPELAEAKRLARAKEQAQCRHIAATVRMNGTIVECPNCDIYQEPGEVPA